jgi:hypothetical protein
MSKNCLQCGTEFEDKTSNQNKVCCSKVCVNRLWYLRKTNKTVDTIRHKNTFESYKQTVLDLGLIFLRIEKNTKQPQMVVQCDNGHEWVSSITNLKKTKGGCRQCYGISRRTSLEEVKNEVENRNFIFDEASYQASNKKILFKCNKCSYAWNITFSDFKRYSCPGCKSGTENKVREIFEILTNKKFPSVRPQWLKNPNSNSNGIMQLDGYCEELQLAFEYDGEFHFVPYWGTNTTSSLMATQVRDQIKDELCATFGITLIRIPYTQKKNLKEFIKNKLIEIGILHV